MVKQHLIALSDRTNGNVILIRWLMLDKRLDNEVVNEALDTIDFNLDERTDKSYNP
jgi:hypothetical protein